MNGFVDLHCHMLYGVDDGAVTKEEMCAMLDMAYADGTRHICLTPHVNDPREDDEALPREQVFSELLEYAKKYPDLTLYEGNELFFSHGAIEKLRSGEAKTLAGTRYVLVEFLPSVSYFDMVFALKQLVGAGYFPILAHVERYGCLYKRKKELFAFSQEQGVFFQVNGSSLLGKWGLRGKRFAWKALSTGAVVSVASDAHGWEHRPPCLGKVYALVEKKLGTEVAKALFYDLPMAILEGQRLSY